MKPAKPSGRNAAIFGSPTIGEPLYLHDHEIAARKLQAQEFARLMRAIGRLLNHLFKANNTVPPANRMDPDRNGAAKRAVL